MSRGPTTLMTAEKRARVLELLTELGSPKLVAERLGETERRVREIAREEKARG